MSVKIAFTGSHCTGKTTLLNDVESILSNKIVVNSVTEVARKIIDKGYPLNKDATVDSYVHYINDQLSEEAAKMNGCDVFISDRTLLDPVAYAMVNSRLPRPYIPQYFINMMENVWLLEKDKYDFYVYFPVEFELEIDKVRPFDDVYRKDIDKMIEKLLKQNSINYMRVTGDRLERTDYLLSLINNCLYNKSE